MCIRDSFVEMGRKTVIRRLAKFLPLSVEFQTASALDAMASAGQDQHTDAMDGDYSILPDDAPQTVDQDTGEIHDAPQIEQKQPQTVPQEIQKAAPVGDWRPDPEEEAAIRAAERQEAMQSATPARQRRERGGMGIE